jgi:hypothetical protein
MVLHKGSKKSTAGDFLRGYYHSSAWLCSHGKMPLTPKSQRRNFCRFQHSRSAADIHRWKTGISKYSNKE